VFEHAHVVRVVRCVQHHVKTRPNVIRISNQPNETHGR
jgi:hypothetical protein